MQLQPFQERFLRGMEGAQISCFSAPRGAGKSWLSAQAAADALRKAGRGQEIGLVAGSVDQGRICFRFARSALGETGYRYLDSAQRCVATCLATGASLRVLPASGRTAMGLVNMPLVIADEPAAWRPSDGALLADALVTALGKPGSDMRLVLCGTLAPLGTDGHWWAEMVKAGTRPGVYVQLHQGDRDRWQDLRHVYAVNPLAKVSKELRETLKRERDEAMRDSRLLARFLSYRLNIPERDAANMLLEDVDLDRVFARPVPERDGQPFVAYDLGHSRAWSAAVALWPNGRCEALAIAPGIPSIADQEKRDRVPSGTYSELPGLTVADGLRVPPPAMLHDAALAEWGPPLEIVCDHFKLNTLRDAGAGDAPIQPRRTRWSEATEDIAAFRAMALDGPLSLAPESRSLLGYSMAMATTKHDESGGTRLVKSGFNNCARDDVAFAAVLAAGLWTREMTQPPAGEAFFVGFDGTITAFGKEAA